MKATGIVRSIDELGRIVIPIELRKTLGLRPRDELAISVNDDGSIVLEKYHFSCTFCGSCEDIVDFKNQCVCEVCLKEIKNLQH